MAYENFKGLPKRTALDKVLRIELLILLKIANIMESNVDLPQ